MLCKRIPLNVYFKERTSLQPSLILECIIFIIIIVKDKKKGISTWEDGDINLQETLILYDKLLHEFTLKTIKLGLKKQSIRSFIQMSCLYSRAKQSSL